MACVVFTVGALHLCVVAGASGKVGGTLGRSSDGMLLLSIAVCSGGPMSFRHVVFAPDVARDTMLLCTGGC